MGTRQTRLLSPTPAALASLTGRLVQLILTDGEVLRGVLEAGAAADVLHLRLHHREPLRPVPLMAVREVFADLGANR